MKKLVHLDELLVAIFAPFTQEENGAEELIKLRASCRSFRVAADDEQLYLKLCKRQFPSTVAVRESLEGIRGRSANLTAGTSHTWKSLYVQRYLVDNAPERYPTAEKADYLIAVELWDDQEEHEIRDAEHRIREPHQSTGKCIYSAVHELRCDETAPNIFVTIELDEEEIPIEPPRQIEPTVKAYLIRKRDGSMLKLMEALMPSNHLREIDVGETNPVYMCHHAGMIHQGTGVKWQNLQEEGTGSPLFLWEVSALTRCAWEPYARNDQFLDADDWMIGSIKTMTVGLKSQEVLQLCDPRYIHAPYTITDVREFLLYLESRERDPFLTHGATSFN